MKMTVVLALVEKQQKCLVSLYVFVIKKNKKKNEIAAWRRGAGDEYATYRFYLRPS